MTTGDERYEPVADRSVPAEDDALLRRPQDEGAADPDVEQLPGYNPNPEQLEHGSDDTDASKGDSDD